MKCLVTCAISKQYAFCRIIQYQFIATAALQCFYIIAGIAERRVCFSMIYRSHNIRFNGTVAFKSYNYFFSKLRYEEHPLATAAMRAGNTDPGCLLATFHPVKFYT